MVDVIQVTHWICGKCESDYDTEWEAKDCCSEETD